MLVVRVNEYLHRLNQLPGALRNLWTVIDSKVDARILAWPRKVLLNKLLERCGGSGKNKMRICT